jgi:hypothetical protein
VCWGTGRTTASNFESSTNPLEYLWWAAETLRTGYNEGDAYVRISNWNPKPVWYCEHCDEDHPEGERCPEECSYCESQVDWGEHNTCGRHRQCWDDDDTDGCPDCAAENAASAAE